MATFFQSLRKKLSHRLPELFLLIVWFLVCITNYIPNTWLLGWDSLVPEFNYALNAERMIAGTWQEYQGLGLTGGMGHNADITRQVFLWFAALFTPAHFVRYFWSFAMLLLGPLGLMKLVRWLFSRQKIMPSPMIEMSVLVAGLYYLLNLATVQYFYTPLETFSSFYGFLPWLLVALLTFWQTKSKKDAFYLALTLVAASSAFAVQTMFVVFGVIILCLSLSLFTQKSRRHTFTLLSLTGLLILFLNLFWFIPVVYFTVTSANNTVDSLQNQLATPETQLQNKGFGQLRDIALLKGYWFEYTDYDPVTKDSFFLMDKWRVLYEQPVVALAGYLLWLIILIGYVYLVKTKHPWRWGLLLTLLVAIGMLTSGNGLFGLPYSILSKALPLFSQIFRTTFTKWSMVVGSMYAVGIAYGVLFLQLQTRKYTKHISALPILGILLLLCITTFPVFKGQLIYDKLQVELPSEYTELFTYANSLPANSRILHAPFGTIWGWQFNNWGYRGSGFLWYGMPQPIVDRNFDVWSPTNETAYHQLLTAYVSKDTTAFNTLLETYNISYVLVDTSIVIPYKNDKLYGSDTFRTFLDQAGAGVVWSSGTLSLYQAGHVVNNTSFNTPNYSSTAVHRISYNTVKDLSIENGSYISNHDNATAYPFDLLLSQSLENVQRNKDSIQLTSKNTTNATVLHTQPLTQSSHISFPVLITLSGTVVTFRPLPPATINSVPLPTLASWQVELPEAYQSVTFDISSEPISVVQNEPKKTWIHNTSVGEALPIRYFDTARVVQENNNLLITQDAVSTATISADIWLPVLQKKSIALDATDLSLSIEVEEVPVITNNKASKQNCDTKQRGVAEKQIKLGETVYIADDYGSYCEGITINKSTTLNSYLIFIKGINTRGRSLKTFIEHGTSGYVSNEHLLDSKEFSEYLPLISTNKTDEKYSFHVEARSLGGERSENTLSTVSLLTLPYTIEWLAGLSTNPDTVSEYAAATVEDISNIGTGIYSIRVSNLDENTLFSLFQSYDPAWVAFPKNKPWQLLEHVIYNGWANAWIITNEKSDADTTTDTNTIIILYWPQLLSFAGYGILTCTLLVVGYKALREKPIATKNIRKTLHNHLTGKH